MSKTVKKTVLMEVSNDFDLHETLCKALLEGDAEAVKTMVESTADIMVAGPGVPDKRPKALAMIACYTQLKPLIEDAIIGVNVGGRDAQQLLEMVVTYLQPFIYELTEEYASAVWEQALRPEDVS